MDGSIQLTAQERKMLLQVYCSRADACTSRRAHILLLNAQGLTWQQIKDVLFCSFDLISQVLEAFTAGGVAAVLQQQRAQRPDPV